MMLQVPKWRIFAFDDDDDFFFCGFTLFNATEQIAIHQKEKHRQQQKWIYGQESKKWLLQPNLVHYVHTYSVV